ncbi:hypothetical protein CLIB1423_08S03686 [[Candida] railenensis]|uniref:Uncharacterized protein n=1 Tax=[Candida] railenensis TaxID=45579 RepID=A0A9P0VXU5_9ASCO|nr:hypothetical protein CLIB1423_08S03686 [[Candida] railenensis]
MSEIVKKEEEVAGAEFDAGHEDVVEASSEDYSKLMQQYQDKFNIAYMKSQSLWKAEKLQRQTLYSYQRKVNSLLDLLSSYEVDPKNADTEKSEHVLRIENLLKSKGINPKLKSILEPLKEFKDTTKIQNNNHSLNLYLTETIPEVVGDEIDHLEVNPQDAEAWVRRQYPHLVVSKFKPVNVSSTSIQNTVEAPASRPGVKRRRRTPVTAAADQDTEREETGSPQPK